MSKIKAKKKKPIDIESHRYTYTEMKEIANRISEEKANAKAIELFRQYSAQNASDTGVAVLQLCCIVLNDKWGFGKKGLKNFTMKCGQGFKTFRKAYMT